MSELVLSSRQELVLASGFAPRLVPVIVDGTLSIVDILLQVGFTVRDFARMSVTIGDHEIPADRWHRVRPKPAAEALMKVNVRPLGGEGGNVLGIVLGVLLVAGAIAISGGALAFTVGGALDIGLGGGTLLFGAGSFEASLAAAAVLGLGKMGLEALYPSSVKTKNEAGLELGNAGVRSNVLKAGDYLPRTFGTNKTWPPQVTKPIRFFEGRDEIVEALYAVAGRTVLDDVRIGGVPAADVAGVTVQVIDWNSVAEEQTLLQQYGAAKSVGRPVQWYTINKNNGDDLFDQNQPQKSVPAWDMAALPDADEWRLRLSWTEGLSKRAANDALAIQPLRLRMRPRAGGDWVNLPEVWFRNNEASAAYKKDIIIRRGDAVPLPAVSDINKTAYRALVRAPGQGRYPLTANGSRNGVGSQITGERFCLVTGGTTAAPIAVGYPTVTSTPADGTVWYMKVLEETPAGIIAMVCDGVAFNISVGTLDPTIVYQMTWSSANNRFQTVVTSTGNVYAGMSLEPKTDDWLAHSHFGGNLSAPLNETVAATQNVALLDEGVAFFISEAVMPRVPIEVQVIAGATGGNGEISDTRYASMHWSWNDWVTVDFFGYSQHSGSAKYTPQQTRNYTGQIGVNELGAFMKSPPSIGINKHNAALIAVRGRNVQVADITALATSVVYDRNSETWLPTDKPARLSEALARGESTHRGVSAEIDEAAYDDWHNHCLARGYRVGFETAGGRWDDIQKTLASAGRAGFAAGQKWRPYYDRNRAAEHAIMAFTPANSRWLGLSRSWPAVRTDALRVTWRESSDDYLERSTIVYAPGIDVTSYRGLEDIAYPDVIDEALAIDRAKFDLAVMRHRGARLQFETDHAAEAVKKGDLVVGIYDVLAEVDASHAVNERAASQSSYITEVTRDGDGRVIGLELNRPVYVEPTVADFFALTDVFDAPNVMTIGEPYMGLVTVGRDDPDDEVPGYVLQLELDVPTSGPTRSIGIVPASIPRSDRIDVGQIFSAGRMKRLRRRGIVESVMPQGPVYRITLVPEAPEIFA